jgi:hypothetical protein
MSNYPAWESVGDLTAEDVFDSRDAEAWLDWWDDEMIAEQDASNGGTDLADLRTALQELRAECEGYGWEYGIGFIRETYFEDYARELASDIGAIDGHASWPLMHIDWEGAARDLAMDYSTCEVDDMTYYWREA